MPNSQYYVFDNSTGSMRPVRLLDNGDGTFSPGSSTTVDTAALVTLTAAGTGTTASADQVNLSGRGLKVFLSVTAATGTGPTTTIAIQVKDPVAGTYVTVLTGAALAGVGTQVLTVYPGLTAVANVAANDILTRTWRVTATVAGTTPAVTATVSASVVA